MKTVFLSIPTNPVPIRSYKAWGVKGMQVPLADSRKKILFVIDTLQMGGAEQSLLANISSFKNTRAVVCHLYKGDQLKNQFIAKGIPVYSGDLSVKYGFVTAFGILSTIVEKEMPDLIVAYLTRSELVARAVAKATGIPLIGTFISELYSGSYNRELSFRARLGVLFFRLLNGLTAPVCKGFIANSETIKRSNSSCLHINPGKIKVINRGRDSRIFTFFSRPIEKNQPIGFLSVGRLVPLKGYALLVQAFANFLRQYPGALLDIVGGGPDQACLSRLILDLKVENNIRLLGNRKDVPNLLHQYDCFVFPSYSEGFSGALVEAMMSGLPILAGNIPANQELLTHLETGYLFESGSVDSLSKALGWFCEHRFQAAGIAAKAYMRSLQYFEQESIAEQMENYLCQKIVSAV